MQGKGISRMQTLSATSNLWESPLDDRRIAL